MTPFRGSIWEISRHRGMPYIMIAGSNVSVFHPRNRHQGRYDFPKLIESDPTLASFVRKNDHDDLSVDFADPAAVKALNRALLKHYYGLLYWDIPPGYLCPPIPGRADYIHTVADLLSTDGKPLRGPGVRVLDIGVGASCIYPLIGHFEYGWSFVGTDLDSAALASARAIVDGNPELKKVVELRLQTEAPKVFQGLLHADESFDATLCNPPFHASLEEAREGARRKWRNLGRGEPRTQAPALNFGGQASELWCEGGELGFIRRMIEESAGLKQRCRWFTTLVSKESNLPAVEGALKAARVRDYRTMDLAQGQKKSRIVAWTYKGGP